MAAGPCRFWLIYLDEQPHGNSLVVDSDETIYASAQGHIYVLTGDGQILWHYENSKYSFGSLALSFDGTLYALGSNTATDILSLFAFQDEWYDNLTNSIRRFQIDGLESLSKLISI